MARLGCGLLAFLVGAGLMVVFLVPPLVGRWIEGEVESEFTRTRQGELRVDDLSLGWFTPQGVGAATLLGPDGGQVARAQLELPSLRDLLGVGFALAADERADFGTVRVRLDADLVVDEDGTSNLDRALALRPGVQDERSVRVERGGEPVERLDELVDALRLLDGEVLVTSNRVSVSTPQTRAGAVDLALESFEARLLLAAGEPVQLVASGRSSTGGSLALTGTLDGVTASGGSLAVASGRLEATLERLPTAILAAFTGQGADLVTLVGPEADGKLMVTYAAGQANRAALDVSGRQGEAHVSLVESAGLLELDPGATNGLTLAMPRAWFEERLAPLLPPEVRLAPVGEAVQVSLTLLELSLPAPDGLDPAAFDPARATLSARGSVGGLALRLAPPAGAGGVEAGGTPAAPIDVRVRGVNLEVTHDPADGLIAHLDGTVEPEGRLTLDARLPAPGVRALLAGESPLGLEVDAAARGFPTGLVDALARQDGLLVDVLGPTLEATAQARDVRLALGGASAPEGASEAPAQLDSARLNARLESDLGRVDFDGRLEGRRLVATGGAGLEASARLSPLLSERIVGPLLPLLVALEKPGDAAPLRISVPELSFPLDAAPGEIDALVRLELGDIRAQLLPSLAAHLSGVRELQPQVHRLLPFEVRIERGVASYTDLPIVLDGKRIDLAGTFSLVSGALDLRTELPLHYLGGEVRQVLKDVAAFVPQDLAVPVSLVGTVTRPRVRVPDDFVQDLLRSAMQRVVPEQLGGDKLEEQLKSGARDKLRELLEGLNKRDG